MKLRLRKVRLNEVDIPAKPWPQSPSYTRISALMRLALMASVSAWTGDSYMLTGELRSQIDGSNVVRDDGAAGSTAQPDCGFRVTPPYAIVHAIPEFIWGMSVDFGGSPGVNILPNCGAKR
jgi:hypothetical protein